MKKLTIAGACLLTSLAIVTGASADSEHARNLAAKQCAAEMKADKAAFKAAYGDHAMRACIKDETPEVAAELKNASKECKDERQSDPDGFAGTYGDGPNAHGKCVSTKVREDRREEVRAFRSASQDCRDAREADREAFQDAWGDNKNGRNALGKCVSEKSEGGDPS